MTIADLRRWLPPMSSKIRPQTTTLFQSANPRSQRCYNHNSHASISTASKMAIKSRNSNPEKGLGISITPMPAPEPPKRRTSILNLFRRKTTQLPPPFTTATSWIPYDWILSTPPPPRGQVPHRVPNGIQVRTGAPIVCPHCKTKIQRYLGCTSGEEGHWIKYVQKKGDSVVVDLPSIRGSEVWESALMGTELLGEKGAEMDFVRYFQGVECKGCGKLAKHDLVAVRVVWGREEVQRCAFI